MWSSLGLSEVTCCHRVLRRRKGLLSNTTVCTVLNGDVSYIPIGGGVGLKEDSLGGGLVVERGLSDGEALMG